jgi:hypothetical protein
VVEGKPPSITSSGKAGTLMFGCEEYSDEELQEIILEKLPECKRVQLEWIAAIASMNIPTKKDLARVYQFARQV